MLASYIKYLAYLEGELNSIRYLISFGYIKLCECDAVRLLMVLSEMNDLWEHINNDKLPNTDLLILKKEVNYFSEQVYHLLTCSGLHKNEPSILKETLCNT